MSQTHRTCGSDEAPKLRVCDLYSRYPETYQNVEPDTGDWVGGGGHLLGSKIHYPFPDILQMAFSDTGLFGFFLSFFMQRERGKDVIKCSQVKLIHSSVSVGCYCHRQC